MAITACAWHVCACMRCAPARMCAHIASCVIQGRHVRRGGSLRSGSCDHAAFTSERTHGAGTEVVTPRLALTTGWAGLGSGVCCCGPVLVHVSLSALNATAPRRQRAFPTCARTGSGGSVCQGLAQHSAVRRRTPDRHSTWGNPEVMMLPTHARAHAHVRMVLPTRVAKGQAMRMRSLCCVWPLLPAQPWYLGQIPRCRAAGRPACVRKEGNDKRGRCAGARFRPYGAPCAQGARIRQGLQPRGLKLGGGGEGWNGEVGLPGEGGRPAGMRPLCGGVRGPRSL